MLIELCIFLVGCFIGYAVGCALGYEKGEKDAWEDAYTHAEGFCNDMKKRYEEANK